MMFRDTVSTFRPFDILISGVNREFIAELLETGRTLRDYLESCCATEGTDFFMAAIIECENGFANGFCMGNPLAIPTGTFKIKVFSLYISNVFFEYIREKSELDGTQKTIGIAVQYHPIFTKLVHILPAKISI